MLDGIPTEVYKVCLPLVTEPFHTLLRLIWKSEKYPTDWNAFVLFPLPKRGQTTGISLLGMVAEAFTQLVLNRFRCIEIFMHSTRKLVALTNCSSFAGFWDIKKFQRPIATCFVDFRVAFSSIVHEGLLSVVPADDIPSKLVRLMKSYYTEIKAPVRLMMNSLIHSN